MTKIPYPSKKFDIVLCSLVLDHVKDWNKTFKEFKRVLKPKGIVVFSIPNPLFTKRVKTKIAGKEYCLLGHTRKKEKRLRIFGDYFDESKKDMTWGESKVPCYQKTYETVIRHILKGGFNIIDYIDAKPIARAKKANLRDYNIFSRLPWFCVWKMQKI